ncbi:MAG TPA: DUF1697 domain-containing protein, partial [Anaerolineales bacterium]|nr:DUF1697 domain-containing protein [Anaerolineales bacterium]
MTNKNQSLITYVAFLRGIGGTDTKIKMQLLKEAFEGMGFQNVRTVIASGNVIFEAALTSEKDLEQTIEKALPGAIGFGADTIIYTFDELQRLAKSSLASDMKVTAQTRPFVTFLKETPKSIPKLSGRGFKLVGSKGRAVFSLIDLSSVAPSLMNALDREFDKKTTTRSWMT